MVFAAAGHGQSALLLTVYAEPVIKLVEQLRRYSFFSPGYVGQAVQFLSLQHIWPRASTPRRKRYFERLVHCVPHSSCWTASVVYAASSTQPAIDKPYGSAVWPY